MLLKMKEILLICVSFLFLVEVKGNCYLEDVTEDDWRLVYKNEPKQDNTQEFKTFKIDNITSVTVEGVDYGKYFERVLVLDENVLKIISTEEFKNFEKNENSVSDDYVMNIFLNFQCTNGSSKQLSFYQPIIDLNTWEPAFTEESYEYDLPMPLPADINLACFGLIIEACDYDITNTNLSFTIDPPEDFSIKWEDATDSTNKCHRPVLKTKRPLRLTDDKEYTLFATDTGSPIEMTGEVKLIIKVDQEATIPPNPHFEQAYYTATYSIDTEGEHSINVAPIHLSEGYSDYTSLDVSEEYKEFFTAEPGSNQIGITLNKPLPEEILQGNSFVLVTITASLQNADNPGRTVVVVQLPPEECPGTTTPDTTTVCPTTEQSTECPPCTTEPPITTECPPCTTESPTTPTECPTEPTECPSITTECPPCTTESPTTPTECPTEPTECPPCTTDFPTTPTECSTTSDPGESTPPSTECPTECPTTECPITTECPPGTTIPTDPTTTCDPEPPIKPSLKYERENYWLDTEADFNGFIGFVRAIAVPEEPIAYSWETVDGSPVPLALYYDQSDGAVRVVDNLNLGKYALIATAKGLESNIETHTSVVINVCEECGKQQTKHSVLVKHVKENLEGAIDLCQPEEDDCNYESFDQYPPTTPVLFEFREGKVHHGELSRLMTEVKDMKEPQFLVSLQLLPSLASNRNSNFSHSVAKRNALYDEEREWVYLPENVLNAQNQLLMAVIIDDVNDNSPVFDEGEKLVVGYPVKDLANKLAPPYLTKVHATDLDTGKNAEIKYSITSTHFIIHPKTGVIYPTESVFDSDDNLKFDVEAKDLDGDADGNSARLEIEVKPLKEDYLTVLLIKNLLLEDIDNKLKELSEKTSIELKYLTASVIPGTSEESFTRKVTSFLGLTPRADSNHLTKIVLYALDSEDEPVKTDELKEELEEAGSLEGIIVDKWNPPSDGDEDCDCDNDNDNDNNTCDEPPSTVGFIVAVSVLAVLLVMFIIAAAAFYYFKIYRVKKSEPYLTMEEEDSGSINFEKGTKKDLISTEEEPAPKRRPTGFVFNSPPIEEDEDEYDENKVKYEEPKDFYTKMSNDEKDGYSSPVEYSRSISISAKDYEEDEFGERKVKPEDSPPEYREKVKSVSFKPTVEKINIVVEDEKQDDDILDQRL